MIEINCDGKETKIVIKGSPAQVGLEMSQIARNITESQEVIAGAFILGMSQVLPREKLDKMVECFYSAKEKMKKKVNDVFKDIELPQDLKDKLNEMRRGGVL